MTFFDIKNIVFFHKKLLIAYSGGLDSTVLLHKFMLLRERIPDIELRAIHIHHGVSNNADEWVSHCQLHCEKWNIQLLIERVLLINEGLGMEGHARKARYLAFKKALLPGEVLVTAQHLDDQSETFLMALKRGSGPAGLSSMPIQSKFGDTQLFRPLLGETRKSLLHWAKMYSLSWVEDESNQNEKYDRNFLRLRILPLLRKRWPHFSRVVARSATLCAEQEKLLNELLNNELMSAMLDHGGLSISPLLIMSSPHRAVLLRRWLAVHGAIMPSRKMLNRIWDEVAKARKDASPCLCLGDYEIRRFQKCLWYVKKYPLLKDNIVNWPSTEIHNILILPQGIGHVVLKTPGNIRLPLLEEKVSIRFKASGLLHILNRNRGRKLKKIWQELNVPPWLRNVVPLLFYNETLIAAAGIFVTREGWTSKGVRFEWNMIDNKK